MDINDLEEENKKLKEILNTIDKYQEIKMRRVFGEIKNEEVVAIVKDNLLENSEVRERIVKSLGKNFVLDDFSFSTLLHGSIIGNYDFSCAQYDKDESSLSNDNNFLNTVSLNSLMQIIVLSESYETMPYSKTFYNPLVSALYSIGYLLENRIKNQLDDESIINKHGKILTSLLPYIDEALNSLESTIVLFTRKSYNQAAISMRTFIEEFIVIATLAHFPNTIEKFLFHNELKVKEELDAKTYKKEIDEYLKSQGIDPTNLTLRSKYIDYGWMDQIKEFESDKSKKMYKPKTMSRLIGFEEYYEWYADLSNYVHSNFLYLKIDWNKFMNLQFHRLANIMLKFLDLYTWLTDYTFDYKGINLFKYLSDLYNAYTNILEKTGLNFKMDF